MKRLLFIWDAAPFGGHDISAIAALKHLAANPALHIGALHTGRNTRLQSELERIATRSGRLEIILASAPPCASESLDGLLRGPRTHALEQAIRKWVPDGTIHAQGFITLGLCALSACRALRIPAISFLPMTHRVWTLRPTPISLLQDLLNHYWYSIPSAFIVTSNRMKQKLIDRKHASAQHVSVVEYGPPLSDPSTTNQSQSRAQLNIANDKTIIGVIGRVEFRQKRHDFLIRAVAKHRTALTGVEFIVIGDGPDLAVARAMTDRLGVSSIVRFMPWQADMTPVYPALNAVLIPSRFEGVPLVMLEAMSRRIPVLATNIDGMADFLPPECLFQPGDATQMIQRIQSLSDSPTQPVLDQLAELVRTRLNTDHFTTHFEKVVTGMMDGSAPLRTTVPFPDDHTRSDGANK